MIVYMDMQCSMIYLIFIYFLNAGSSYGSFEVHLNYFVGGVVNFNVHGQQLLESLGTWA